jgi:hypothetical protein
VSQGSSFNSVKIERGSEINGVSTFYKFTISLINPVPNRAILTVQPPAEINIAAQQGTYVDCQGHGNLKQSQLCILVNKRVTVNLALEKAQLQSGDLIELTIYGVSNPKAIKESESFALELLSSDSAFVYSRQDQGITVLNKYPNLIEVASIQATKATLGADSSYTIDFLPANSLPDRAIIQLALPDSLTPSVNVPLECVGIKNLFVGSLVCTYD